LWLTTQALGAEYKKLAKAKESSKARMVEDNQELQNEERQLEEQLSLLAPLPAQPVVVRYLAGELLNLRHSYWTD
jgi:hypothetical protein